MSEGKIRCIIKRPDEQYGHVTNISTSLKNLQRIVDGPIEIEQITPNVAVVCNEEGKIRKLQRNFIFGFFPFQDVIVGEAIIIGTDHEDLVDLPEHFTFAVWKKLLKEWGN